MAVTGVEIQARAAARAHVALRHVLEEDVEAIVERAGRLWDLFET